MRRNELCTNEGLSGIFELGQIPRELDAACFATAAGVNLRLHQPGVTAQLTRLFNRFGGAVGDIAGRDRYAVFGK